MFDVEEEGRALGLPVELPQRSQLHGMVTAVSNGRGVPEAMATLVDATGTVVGSTLAAILFAAIGSSLIFLNVSAYWLKAVLGLLILVTVLADMARRRRAF